jgi:ribose transport system substrate-binding protein
MRYKLVALTAALLLLAIAGCSTGASSGGGDGKYQIALSNSYIGNKWRIEMVNDFKSTCASKPWKTQVDCSVYNSGNDVSKQSQQISNLISQRVDAILIDAASPTGLNGVIKQACDRGILVISFDALATAPCALTVATDNYQFGKKLAEWLVQQLHGQGNIIQVTGVAGTSVDTDRNKGAADVLKQNPGINVVAKYDGEWDSSSAQRATAAQLPSLPKVDGIWAQGGTDGILKAFIEDGRPLPPTAGEAENGFRKFMMPGGYNGHHVTAISIGQPPYLSVVSLELARQILNGDHPTKSVALPFPVVTNDTIKPGVNVFPDLEDSFFDTFTDSGPDATVLICKDAALTGKACPQPPKVQLPGS